MDEEKIKKIMQTAIKLPQYPVNKFKGALEKILLVLKLAKDIGFEDGLLTIEINKILEKKLRSKKIPSSVLSNAAVRAELKGYVTSIPIAAKRQRKYKIDSEGAGYIQECLNKK